MATEHSLRSLVEIPNCTATHILGSTSILLASGQLSLVKSLSNLAAPAVGSPVAAENLQASPISESAPTSTSVPTPTSTVLPHPPIQVTPVFTLQIGILAFPLLKSTLFGTSNLSPLVYLFAPELGPAGQAAQGGYVKLELPKDVGDKQEEFEKALIGEGLLKEGWEAVGDELGRGVTEGAERGAKGLDRVAANTSSFSPAKSAQTVSDAASGAGTWIGNTVGALAGAMSDGTARARDVVANSLAAEGGGIPAEAIEEDEDNRKPGPSAAASIGDAVAGVRNAVANSRVRDVVVNSLSTETGRVPPEAIEPDEEDR